MADPFQPRFVDLVRNFTSTAGTGNLVLDDAAPGFASFASALQPGDQFHYSVIGLDKTTETEVGRGTLLPDGSIARDPIGGVFTNFSQGRKSVALVAAAEWFQSIEEVRGAPPSAADRTALAGLAAKGAAILAEGGRQGLFTFDGGDRSAEVSADTAQGVYVAPATDPTGASGAWVRQFSGAIDPAWFGLVEGSSSGANAAANDVAWAALQAVRERRAVNVNTSFHGLEPIRFGPGQFEFATTIDLYGVGVIEGSGIAGTSGHPTILKFFDCTGFRLQGSTTLGDNGYNAALGKKGSSGTIFRDLAIYGNYSTGAAEAEYHGISARARFTAENVVITGFAGDGYHIWADTNIVDGSNPPSGAANGWRIIGGRVASCRNGISLAGGDANAGSATQVDISICRQWAINEYSLLGNNFDNCKIASCGRADIPAGNIPTTVFHVDGRYGVIDGQEAGASTNAPSGTGVDNSWWYFWKTATGPSAASPQWVSGTTYRAGGSVRSANIGAAPVFNGIYAEADMGLAQTVSTTQVNGGILSSAVRRHSGQGPVTAAAPGYLSVFPGVEVDGVTSSGATGYMRMGLTGGNIGSTNYISLAMFGHSTLAEHGLQLKFHEGDNSLRLDYQNNNNQVVFQIAPPGAGHSVPYAFYAPKLIVGDSFINARRLTNSNGAAPATGTFDQGSFSFDRSNHNRRIGFKATAGGTPGTWQALFGLAVAPTAAGEALLDDVDAAAQRTTLGLGNVDNVSDVNKPVSTATQSALNAKLDVTAYIKGIEFHCAGIPANGEVIGGGIAPYALTLNESASSCKALVAATAQTILLIKNDGVEIGTITFAAAGTEGTVDITAAAVAAGDHISFHNAAAADATLADISGLLRG